jgi:hypothetical protein
MKKFVSKWFRVAVEGATTDGRKIERSWIEEMAAGYDPKKYGARIWMEHIRSTLADSPFRAYGDVLAVKAEEVEIDGEKRLALFAQIEPTNDLVNMVNKLKQKIFTSIEVMEKFAGTGKAYLMGLAVTDTPASLGTEMLAFSAQHPEASPLMARKQAKENLFTAAAETELVFEEVEEKPGLFARVQDLLKGIRAESTAEFTQFSEAVEAVATHIKERGDATDTALTELRGTVEKLSTDFAALQQKLSASADPQQPARPAVTGSGAQALTEF